MLSNSSGRLSGRIIRPIALIVKKELVPLNGRCGVRNSSRHRNAPGSNFTASISFFTGWAIFLRRLGIVGIGMLFIAALIVEKELEDARERRANPSTTDAISDKFEKAHPKVYKG